MVKQKTRNSGDKFLQISKETLLWIVVGSSVASLGEKELTMERMDGKPDQLAQTSVFESI